MSEQEKMKKALEEIKELSKPLQEINISDAIEIILEIYLIASKAIK
jgi:hypothetical protein